MFKKLFSVALIILISSCVSRNSTDLTNDSVNDQKKGVYETVSNKDEATKINEEVSSDISEEIEVEDRVFFSLNSSKLTNEAKKVLDGQSEWLKSESGIKITIEGHCDERGTREYNIALGEKRANASRDYLIANGVSADRIKTVSYGKEKPAMIGHGKDIWSKNRRSVTVPVE